MSKFDNFCNLILEAYGKRMDISPADGRPGPDRYNNPGGAYPSQKFEKYGMEGHGILKDPKTGSTHPIGRYPTLANGIAANMAHLKSMPVIGKTVAQARYYLVNGRWGGTMPLIGMDNNQVITAELLNDPNWLSQWMRATAAAEGFGNKGRRIDDASMQEGLAMLKSGGDINPNKSYASADKQPQQTTQASGEQPQQTTPASGEQSQQTAETTPVYDDDPDTNLLMSKISNIYSKGITADSAKEALKVAAGAGQDIFKKYSKDA